MRRVCRIRMLESHLGAELFERRRRGVYLNRRGRAYYEEGRRILLDIRDTTERHGDRRRFRGRQGRRPAAPPRHPSLSPTRGCEMT